MSEDAFQFLKYKCRDSACGALIPITSLENSIECLECGIKYEQSALQNAVPITDRRESEWATQQFVRRMVYSNILPKRGPEQVKVNGLSNYYCKLLSPFLTRYGMDKATGHAKLLSEMSQNDTFDCSVFGDRAFLIDADQLSITGFGRDVTGSTNYLSETLNIIKASNGGEERLVPIYTDGDGHCLVHAISRALVGRELFWHPLRCSLKKHFENNLSKYQQLFKDFIQPEDWQAIIEESDPDFKPPEGELHGLRNIHIFGLANVLKRPIILLDSLECMKKCGDYSALFLPVFILPEECRSKDNSLNKPICIAWSSFSHNHYIPLVGVQKRPLPLLPKALIPKVWGMPQDQFELYIESDSNGNCVIGGGRVLTENYIQRLVKAMEALFLEKRGVHPMLVADAKLYLCSESAFLNIKVETVIEKTKMIAQEGRLYRCLNCKATSEFYLDYSLFRAGGLVYNAFLQVCKKFETDVYYKIPTNGLRCKYDPLKNEFIPDLSSIQLDKCGVCQSNSVRRLRTNGTVIYLPEDEEFVSSSSLSFGKENESFTTKASEEKKPASSTSENPDLLVIKIVWNKQIVRHSISWSEFKELGCGSIPASVSNLASTIASKYFPKESSNVELHLHVCDEIWNHISTKVSVEKLKATELKSEENKTKVKEESVCEGSSSKCNNAASSEPQLVKVVSSNGQQGSLTLSKEGISYCQLQEWISSKFKIPAESQLIKWGFPPKEFEIPCDVNKRNLPLKHGDRLIVENDTHSISQRKNYLNTSLSKRASEIHSLAENFSPSQNEELLWKFLLWQPDVFREGGELFKSASDKHILCDKDHIELPGLPHKRFCYNAATSSLELCVKSLGHFLITPDVEERIEAAKRGEVVPGFKRCPQMSGPSKEAVVTRPFRKPITPSPEDGRPLVRKGPGFSVLTSPKPSEKMEFS